MKKALIIATIYPFINHFEYNDIKILQEMGYEVHTIASGESETPNLDTLKVIKNIIPITRNPLSISNLKAYFYIKKYIKNNDIDLVHCHTPVGGVLGRLCNKHRNKNGLAKTIYTAHGFHFFKGNNFLKNFLFKSIEKYCARYTDILITINKEDYEAAKKFKLRKNGVIEYVPGVGIDIDKINAIQEKKDYLLVSLNIATDSFLVISVGEINENKNHRVIIEALPSLPKNIHYIICGIGPLEEHYRSLSRELHVEDRVHLLGYRTDVIKIMKSCDIFVFPSRREGLGIAAIEAMACGLPLITSDRHGILDYAEDGVNAITCSPDNIKQFQNAILYFYKHPMKIQEFGDINHRKSIKYSMEKVEKKMKKIYTEVSIRE